MGTNAGLELDYYAITTCERCFYPEQPDTVRAKGAHNWAALFMSLNKFLSYSEIKSTYLLIVQID